MSHMQTDLRMQLASGLEFLTEKHVRVLMYNLLSAVNSVHSAGLMHRDIKPANILLNSSCHIKLCDFGSARPVTYSEPFEKTSLSREEISKA